MADVQMLAVLEGDRVLELDTVALPETLAQELGEALKDAEAEDGAVADAH